MLIKRDACGTSRIEQVKILEKRVRVEAVISSLPAAIHALCTHRRAKPLDRQSAKLLGMVDAVRTIPARHVGARGFIHTNGVESRDLFQTVPEIVHRTTDLGASLVIVFQLHARQSRADLIGSALYAAECDHGIG